jgi:hypothetical protein
MINEDSHCFLLEPIVRSEHIVAETDITACLAGRYILWFSLVGLAEETKILYEYKLWNIAVQKTE